MQCLMSRYLNFHVFCLLGVQEANSESFGFCVIFRSNAFMNKEAVTEHLWNCLSLQENEGDESRGKEGKLCSSGLYFWWQSVCNICSSKEDCEIHDRCRGNSEPWSRNRWSLEGKFSLLRVVKNDMYYEIFMQILFLISKLFASKCRWSLSLTTMSVLQKFSFPAASYHSTSGKNNFIMKI